MRLSKVKRLQKAHLKQATIVFIALLAFSLLAYAEIIRPNQHARSYESRLSTAADGLHGCFLQLADGGKLPIFYAPDISLAQKQQNIRFIEESVRRCSGELQRFYYNAQTLQRLYLSGYTTEYRQARTTQDHALNVAGQSNDVLNQYAQMTAFLEQYYRGLEQFIEYTDELNRNTDQGGLQDQIPQLRQQAAELRAQATDMRKLKPTPGFEAMIEPTAAMLSQSASGFDSLASGYNRQDDTTVSAGFMAIESAVAAYNSTVQQMSFDLLVESYTTKQIAALPDKIEDLSRTEFE